MGEFVDYLKVAWSDMLEPPWQDSTLCRSEHWRSWLLGWAWAVSGVLLGALIAPALTQQLGLENTSYQDTFVIAVAFIAGFLVQFLGWCLVGIYTIMGKHQPDGSHWWHILILLMYIAAYPVALFMPLASVGYGIYRYLTWVGAGQRSVTVAFVGGFLLKVFLIPFIKGLVTGALFKWFLGWVRGDKPKSA
jgi:hypothetical protein